MKPAVVSTMLAIILAACSGSDPSSQSISWLDTPLENVQNSESFTLAQFEEPVLLESFAVWCPACTKQQRTLQELDKERIIVVSIDTDPSENVEKVREHMERNGFGWRFAIAPTEFTQELINEFSFQVVNAPSSPIVLICAGEARLLPSGHKTVRELEEAIAECGA